MINISKNKCVGCGICVNVCSGGIEILNGRARIKDKNADCFKNAMISCPQGAIKDIKQELMFAIGTDDDKTIKSDVHIGMSRYFQFRYQQHKGQLLNFPFLSLFLSGLSKLQRVLDNS